MRILALRTNGFVLPHIHAFMVKAFRSLDVEVCEIPGPRTLNEIRLFLKTLSDGFDAGFIVDLGDNPTFIQNFREIQLTSKIPWIIWFVDDPDGYQFPESCEPAWSYVFCWDEEISRRLSLDQSWKGRPVIHLPLAVSSEIFFPENPKPELSFPGGVFVGSTRHENSFLEEAAATIPDFKKHEMEIWKIYSKDFNRSLFDLVWEYLAATAGRSFGKIRQEPLAKLWVHACIFKLGIRKRKEVAAQILEGGAVFGDEGWRETMARRYQGAANYGKELFAIYNRSSFVLDIRQPQCRTGLTQRIFDASACGVPVLTELSPELEFLFDPENEISSYRTIEEGIRKRMELLRSPRMARKMAEKARKRVLTEHTYRNRALQILRVFKPGLP
jgi:spore maturation protein CgeB